MRVLYLSRLYIANQEDNIKISESLIQTKLLYGHNHFSLGSEIGSHNNKAKTLLRLIFICSSSMKTCKQFIKKNPKHTNIHIRVKMDPQ